MIHKQRPTSCVSIYPIMLVMPLISLLATLIWVTIFPLSITCAHISSMNTTTDFTCSGDSPSSATCHTFVLYRAQSPDYLNLSAISDLFEVSPLAIKTASNLVSEYADLVPGQLLLVPILCGCTNNMSFANITYQIKNDDSFYLVSTYTFERLTNYVAVEAFNPSFNPGGLKVGAQVIFPLFCRCPTASQLAQGIKHLITYVWQEEDNVTELSNRLNISETDYETANSFRNFTLAIGFPVLIPVKNLPILSQLFYPTSTRNKHIPNHHRMVLILLGAIAAPMIIVIILCVLASFKRSRLMNHSFPVSKLISKNLVQIKIGASDAINLSPRAAQDKLLPRVADCLNNPVVYDSQMVMAATSNLSEKYRIGDSVFRVKINGNYFAVKQTKGDIAEELSILQRVNHANLINISGISLTTDGTYFLVYEFAENGSLDKWLHTKLASCSKGFPSWKHRLSIALDVAHGLQYMHEHTRPSIVHRDIRTSNILLSSQFKAKISNFSMAIPATDPLALKTDVYAFGLLLLELLSGSKALDKSIEGDEPVMLTQEVKMVLECQEKKEERLKKWMDPNLEGFYSIEAALNLAAMAMACTCEKPSTRPSMGEIVFGLTVLGQSSIESPEGPWTEGIREEEAIERTSPVKAR